MSDGEVIVSKLAGVFLGQLRATARQRALLQRMVALIDAVSDWKEREDGLVYSDEPLTSYLLEARQILVELRALPKA